jgi:putative transposase
VFPKTIVQTCVVHLIRSSTRYVTWVDRKAVIATLREVYTAPTEDVALTALAAVEEKWGERYPSVAKSWRTNWERVRPFLAFPQDLRRIIYTTNAIESLNFQLRKIIKAKGHFPNDDATMKLLYLALRNVEKKWRRAPIYWGRALNQLSIHFEGRLPAV